jgi:hypothetical protein
MYDIELFAKKLFLIVGSTVLLGAYLCALWSIVFSPRLSPKSEPVNPSAKVGYPAQQKLGK